MLVNKEHTHEKYTFTGILLILAKIFLLSLVLENMDKNIQL
jgi:hypothetical protein